MQGTALQWGTNKLRNLQVTFPFDVFPKLVQCPVSLWITEVAAPGAALGEKEAPFGAELGAVGTDVWFGLWQLGFYSLFCTGDACFWRVGTFDGIPEGLQGRWACRRDAQGEQDLCIHAIPSF